MARGDIEDAAKDFNIRMEDLDCVRTQQLASQLNVPVAICAQYTEDATRNRTVTASIRTIADSEEFRLEDFSVGERDGDQEAAQQIFAQFDRYNNQVRATAFCSDYAASQQWEDALRQCDAALAINPEANGTRFLRAQLLRELDRNEESLEESRRVLGADPFHEGALQLAGYLATVEGDAEAGREYYRQYLDINPGNVAIRMRIAYEIAQAGDPVGAMEFIQVGLDVEADNADLNDQFGNFAFTAASNAQSAHELGGGQGMSPEAAGFYRQAIDAYMKVFAVRGAEMPEGRLRNIVAAHIQLEEFGDAVTKSEQFLQTHAESEVLWSLYADALQRSDRLEDAIAALEKVLEVNPTHPNAALRQGNWLIQAGRVDEAVAKLTAYVQQNPQQTDQAGRILFADAYTNGYQKNDYAYAIRGFNLAKQLPGLSEGLVRQLNFWHGFALYSQTFPQADAQTLASANATQPKFQEVMRLLADVRPYTQANNINLDQVLTATQQYIDINEALIRRGR
jgi:tetratricopeptide (TPR) repeat protein